MKNSPKPLSNVDIDAMFSNDQTYLGTYSKDMLKGIKIPKDKVSSVVINMQNYGDGGGTHWTCYVNIPTEKYAFYYDSYGVVPSNEVIQWNKQTKKELLYSTSQIQNIESVLCGYYCVDFIEKVTNGMNFIDYLNMFKDNNDVDGFNEKLIKRFSHV